MITIAMPAYNAGKYIKEAIDSILAQTYTEWELIISDDCSTDNTVTIVEEYTAKNNNITLIKRKQNSGGCRLPRFDAILAAKGEFVCPIDSDDTIEIDYLDKLIKRQKETNADIVLGRMVFCDEQQKPRTGTIPHHSFDMSAIFTGKEACERTIGEWEIAMAGLLAKTELYKEYIRKSYNSTFNGGFFDEIDHRKILLNARIVSMVDAHYFYRQQSNSIVHSTSIKSYDILSVNKILQEFTKKEFYNNVNIIKKGLNNFLESTYRAQQRFYLCEREYTSDEKERITQKIKDSYNYLRKTSFKPQGCRNRILFSSFTIFKIYTWGIIKLLKLKNKLKK